MHTSKDDYLINTLRFVSRKEASQKYGDVLPDCLTSPAMKETKAYKTYLGFATNEEPVKKGKRLKTTAKKSAYKPSTGIIIRELVVETKSKSKEKEKVDVAHGKGIELLSDVALTEEAQIKEVQKKSFKRLSQDISQWFGEEENESDKQASDSKQEEESEDDDQEENKDDDDLELESNDETEGDEEIDDTTDQFDDDADARLEEPTDTATGIVQGEGTDAEMTESQQGNENLETTQEQVVEDAHMTISTITKRLKNKLLKMLVFRFNDRISALEKEVAKLKKDPLHTQVTSLVDEHLDTRLGETREECMNLLSESFTARIKEQVKDQLPQIQPQEVSNFAPPVIE
ncbi:hypothetical protein Tco_1545652, partial [Tanacetum coccineum]